MPPGRVRSASPGRRAPTLIVHGGAGADPNDEPDALRDGIRAAVAAVTRIANPVTLARRVMDDGRHVLLAGDGALILVDARGRIGYAQSTSFMPVGWMAPTFVEPQVPF